MKTAIGLSLVSAGASMFWSKRRPYLSSRMNLVSAFLLDPIEAFPVCEYPRDDEQKALEIVRKKRNDIAALTANIRKVTPLPSIGAIQDVQVPSRDPGRTIMCRLYQPTPSSKNETFPVLMEIHGGGWTFASVEAYDGFARKLCQTSRCVVCSVEYRLAPEHKFPAGLEDCEDVFKWLASGPPEVQQLGGRHTEKGFALCGDSAGGNLVTVLSVKAANEWNIKVDLQVLIYPATCAFGVPLYRPPPHVLISSDSMVRNANAPVLPMASLSFLFDCYLANIPNRDLSSLAMDPRVSPILFTESELKSVAECFILTGDCDVLTDGCLAYRDKLRRAGVKVVHKHYQDAVHGFMNLPSCANHEQGNEDVGAHVKQHFERRNRAKL